MPRADTLARPDDAMAEAADLDTLPPGADELLGPMDHAWYRNVLAHGLAAGTRAGFAFWPSSGTPVALVPLRRDRAGGLGSLTTPYTCLYAPLLAPGLDPATIAAAGAALGRFCRPAGRVRLDALDADDPALAALLDGVRSAGLLVRRFDHFGNWYEPVAGRSWAAYLDGRPGALRETVRRKLARAGRDEALRLEIVTGADGKTEPAIAAFEAVYRLSWKQPEPFPHFNAGLIRETARLGTLRLGILRREDHPVAVQLWQVQRGRAQVLKLAHDEAFKPLSPGTVLTALMLRRLLDEERVTELDFGRGDDPYKRQWATRRRQRIGVLLLNPRHPRGLAAFGREVGAAARRGARALLARR